MNKLPDSVIISFDGKPVATLKSAPWEYTIPSDFTVTTGQKIIKGYSLQGWQDHKIL